MEFQILEVVDVEQQVSAEAPCSGEQSCNDGSCGGNCGCSAACSDDYMP